MRHVGYEVPIQCSDSRLVKKITIAKPAHVTKLVGTATCTFIESRDRGLRAAWHCVYRRTILCTVQHINIPDLDRRLFICLGFSFWHCSHCLYYTYMYLHNPYLYHMHVVH